MTTRTDEFGRMQAEGAMRRFAASELVRMVRMDLDEATSNGCLSKEAAADEAMRAILEWKGE